MLVTSIFSFSHNVFYPVKENVIILSTSKVTSANDFIFYLSKILCCGKELTQNDMNPCVSIFVLKTLHCVFNPFPNKPWFLRVCSTRLLKTLREKEKLLVTSNFSFSHSVFYLFGEHSATFIKFENVVCKVFDFGRV